MNGQPGDQIYEPRSKWVKTLVEVGWDVVFGEAAYLLSHGRPERAERTA